MDEMKDIGERLQRELTAPNITEEFSSLLARVKEAELRHRIRAGY